mmetsp:Transcript_6252/g.38888  ORF Transcript_6252/g.38888 Transcript_6252/m.38888 type:complete len:90 (+) Transcript_6252:1502-1771(+)
MQARGRGIVSFSPNKFAAIGDRTVLRNHPRLPTHLNGCQHGRDAVARAPSVLDDVHAQRAIAVHVGMEHFRGEPDPRWFFRILIAEGDA